MGYPFLLSEQSCFDIISFLFSARDGLGFNFPNPMPCLLGWLGNFKLGYTSAFSFMVAFVAFQTCVSLAFKDSRVL